MAVSALDPTQLNDLNPFWFPRVRDLVGALGLQACGAPENPKALTSPLASD